MKKFVAIMILVSVILGGFTTPVFAKAKAKQKTMTAEIICGNNELVKLSLPYYSKWKARKSTLKSEQLVFDAKNDDEISVQIQTVYEAPDFDIFIKGLSDKKNRKKLINYLKYEYDDLPVSEDMFSSVYKFVKDGNGRYMLLMDIGFSYLAIRPLDDEHLLIYMIIADNESVSKSIKKKIVSYAKKTVIKEIVKDYEKPAEKEPRPLNDTCPITLPDDKGWYIAAKGQGENRKDYLWNSRESYSSEALNWVSTMECWFMEFQLDDAKFTEYMELIDSKKAEDNEKAFKNWDEKLYPELFSATLIFNKTAELTDGSVVKIGETINGYPVLQSLFECKGRTITVYLTYNKENNVLQACTLANGEGSRMKSDIEKYVENAIINQQY